MSGNPQNPNAPKKPQQTQPVQKPPMGTPQQPQGNPSSAPKK